MGNRCKKRRLPPHCLSGAIELGKYSMDQTIPSQNQLTAPSAPPSRAADEHNRLNFDEFLRIADLDTDQVFVEQRG